MTERMSDEAFRLYRTRIERGGMSPLVDFGYVLAERAEVERLRNAINPEAANTPADRWDEFAAMVDAERQRDTLLAIIEGLPEPADGYTNGEAPAHRAWRKAQEAAKRMREGL